MSDPMPVVEWGQMLNHTARLVRMALTEAGYPDADVWADPTGVMVQGVPSNVEERAFDLVNEWYDRQGADRAQAAWEAP